MRAGFFAVIAVTALGTSGCFTTRLVRDDTTTSYQLVRDPHATASMPVVPEGTVVAATVPPPPPGTLVVEALALPAPPVRLPASVAGGPASHVTVAASAPAWQPLPSYVAQFAGPGWQHRAMFSGSTGTMTPRTWGRTGWVGAPTSGSASTGSYGSSSPHFSSAPSFSGSASSHFAGGASFSGY